MKALQGVRILDMTHVQSGPTCTQLLAWFGADVIKVERPGVGDATRGQLRDVPDADSLYFTMLNHNKRSITLNTKSEEGQQIFTRLIEACDVMVENFAPGALDRMGFTWARIQEINPRMISASVKGFGPGPYQDCKVYENVAQCTGGGASTTGFDDGPPTVSGAQIGDSGTGLHLALGIVTALFHRVSSGRGQRVECRTGDHPAAALVLRVVPHHLKVRSGQVLAGSSCVIMNSARGSAARRAAKVLWSWSNQSTICSSATRVSHSAFQRRVSIG